MSGYNRQGNRSAPKFDSRIEHKNAGVRSVWKPKPSKTDGSLDTSSCSQINKSSATGESVVKDVASVVKNIKPTPVAFDDEGSSKKVKQLGDKSQTDDGVKNIKPTPVALNDEGSSKKVKQLGDKSQTDDGDIGRLDHPVFDICPKKASSAIKLNPPLHAMNREKRNQNKQAMEGQNIVSLGPGMVHLKGYISSVDQISIVKTCRDLGISDGGFYQPGYSGGTKLHLQMMCLGKNWDPESHSYTELRAFDKSKPPGIPEKFHEMVKKAIHDSNEFIRGYNGGPDERKVVPSMSPDVCIVNFYTKTGRLGLHQDKDESEPNLRKGLPVVSFSIGDSAEFLYGETRNVDEAEKVTLASGDVLIFGGKSRLIYHGVTSIVPDSAPKSLIEATDMRQGRLNLTFRKY